MPKLSMSKARQLQCVQGLSRQYKLAYLLPKGARKSTTEINNLTKIIKKEVCVWIIHSKISAKITF